MKEKNAIRDERYKAVQRATLLSVVINVLLSIGKILAGILGQSAAMLADGIHSASDLVTDGVVLLAMRIAKQEVDEDHPYGYGKYETLATQFVSVALLVVAVGIGWDAWGRMRQPDLATPTSLALWAAILSIVAKEAIFQYTYRLGKRYNAKAMIANAWHHRSDAISSIAALVGILGAMAGVPLFDPLAAIVVALILAKVGLDLFLEAMKDLTDAKGAIDQEVQQQIANLVYDIPGVLSAHLLNPRGLGPDIRVDVHVVVDPYLSVSEGHQIAELVRFHLFNHVEAVTDVLVHVDTDDDLKEPVPILATRPQLLAVVSSVVDDNPLFRRLHRMTPHYRPDGILLELTVEVAWDYPIPLLRKEADRLSARLLAEGDVKQVVVGFVVSHQWQGAPLEVRKEKK